VKVSVKDELKKAFHEVVEDYVRKWRKDRAKRFPKRQVRIWQNPFVSL